MTRVAIMQPTYLPWCGYFGLMMKVDIFILLDSVQFAKRSWQQRNQIKTPQGAKWLTVPVVNKGKQEQLICEAKIDNTNNFSKKHSKTIEINYEKSTFFRDIGPNFLDQINGHTKLVDLNIGVIEHCRKVLKIKTPMLLSSRMHGQGTKADLLASLCMEVGATEYISVPGSKQYLDETDAFRAIGLPVHYFSYRHPNYPQLYGDFIPHMSIIDMLFNCGDKSADLIRNGFQE